MPNTTPRMAIVTPLGTEAVNIDAHLKQIADQVDALTAIFGQGTLASRPTSTPGSPGKTGRFYYATDNGKLYYDYGTGWTLVIPDVPALGGDSITSFELAPNSVTNVEMADNAIGAAEIIDGAVGSAEIAAALKPSQGAVAGTEALRALGTGAGNAAAGNDSRFSEGAAGAVTCRSLGTGATQAAAGNDARLSDDRPTLLSWRPVTSYIASFALNSGAYIDSGVSIVIPATGTYEIGYGGAESDANAQGQGVTIKPTVPANAARGRLHSIDNSGCAVFIGGVACTTGQTIKLQIESSGQGATAYGLWLRAIRTA